MQFVSDEHEYQTISEGQVNIHHNYPHMDNKYSCEECDDQFTMKDSLTKHKQSVHMGKKYSYEGFDYQAKQNYSLTEHQHHQTSHPPRM